jgi:hypothetical protein
MAEEIDELLEQVTYRLRFDPELRLEIQRELRAHFRDKLAECRAADLGEEQSRMDALSSLGNPGDLAAELWRANRARMTSHAIVRWLAVTLLIPAACAVCLVVAFSLFQSAAPIVANQDPYRFNLSKVMPEAVVNAAESQTERLIGPIAADKQSLFSPSQALSENAFGSDGLEKLLAMARAASEAHPQDATYLAQYARLFVFNLGIGTDADSGDPLLSKEHLNEALAIIEQGERVDPDNAFFPLLAAQCLARASSRQLQNQPADYHPWSFVSNDGPIHQLSSAKLEIDDAGTFAQAAATLHRASLMQRFDNHGATLRDRRLALLPAANTLGDVVLRINTDMNSRTGSNWAWDLLCTFSAHALDLAVAGDHSHALESEGDINRVLGMMLSDGQNSNATIFSYGFYPYDVVAGHAAAVLELAGADQQAHNLREWMMDFSQRKRVIFHEVSIDQAPFNRAEYNLADRAALVGLIEALLAFVLFSSLWAAIESLITSNRAGLALVIVPRLGEASVLLLAGALPIVLYCLYITFTPMGHRLAGLNSRYETLMTEYLIVIAASAALGLTAATQIARRRLAAVGGFVPGTTSLGMGIVLMLPALAVVLFTCSALYSPISDSLVPSAAILFSIAGFGAIWLRRALRSVSGANNIRAIGSMFRSLAVMVALLALVIGAAGGIGLHRLETSAVARIGEDRVLSHMNVEMTPGVLDLRRELNQRCASVVRDCAAAEVTTH